MNYEYIVDFYCKEDNNKPETYYFDDLKEAEAFYYRCYDTPHNCVLREKDSIPSHAYGYYGTFSHNYDHSQI